MSSNKQEKALIVAGGDACDFRFLLAQEFGVSTIIAVDKGIDRCASLSVTPHYMVGDYDSCNLELKEQFVQSGVGCISAPREKDESDLELALAHMRESGLLEAYVTCSFGGRIDHVFTNLSLGRHPKFHDLTLLHTDGVQVSTVLAAPFQVVLPVESEVIFSLAPLLQSTISISGSKWELDREIIDVGASRTLSNVGLGRAVEVTIHHGEVLLSLQTADLRLFQALFNTKRAAQSLAANTTML